VTVQSGQTAPVPITLGTVTGVTTWAELNAAVTNADTNDVIVVTANIAFTGTITMPANKNVTILAEGDRELSRDAGFQSSLFSLNPSSANSRLTLGDADMLGTLTLKGGKPDLIPTYDLIWVNDPTAKLVMNDKVFLVDNRGLNAAVYVADGEFEMNGGTISNNDYVAPSSGGGGVFVATTFIMNGGTISGNTSSGSDGGGGVLLFSSSGSFEMNGGTITQNETSGGGGGVNALIGNFIMNGGTVSGNTAVSAGNEVCVGDLGGFSWTGGTTSDIKKYTAGLDILDLKGWDSGSAFSPGGPMPAAWNGDAGAVWTGNGSIAAAAIAITSVSELLDITGGLDKYYFLAADITLGATWNAIGANASPPAAFTGALDGRSHTITVPPGGTTITPEVSGSSVRAGLFAYINNSGALITDLTLAGGAFTATVQTGQELDMGGIVGELRDGVIQNCAVRIDINQNSLNAERGSIGGIAGTNTFGIIKNCYNTGNITGNVATGPANYVQVGGIAGANNHDIQNCYNTGHITGSSYLTYVGGIAGDGQAVTFCYTTGNITGTNYGTINAGYYGGIMGGVSGSGIGIKNCVALNGNIFNTGSGPQVGRIYGASSGTPALTDNYGRDDMQLNNTANSWTNSTTGIDGGNVTMTAANTQAWWQTAGTGPGWTIENPGDGSDINPWEWGSNNLPKLYWE
jgi:hypothetical protein